MRAALLIVVIVVLVGLGGGFLWLGAFPPAPHVHPVERAIPTSAVPAS
ncbi:MAG: hypothetical protein ACREFZ_04600 [Acetobacteraceae bacterium]